MTHISLSIVLWLWDLCHAHKELGLIFVYYGTAKSYTGHISTTYFKDIMISKISFDEVTEILEKSTTLSSMDSEDTIVYELEIEGEYLVLVTSSSEGRNFVVGT
ncbi:hypothetical protein VCR15J2_390100 [Vibrio coralliirubri]|uniref:hypothetical protein n=1 Tax=Vibrio coralliirubri TaxID=1516159 RepID=UPI0006331275|nr:hypothetical protein [Vibrio coralliirubri]CDT53776.1 hypothetical protein VCR15J2_390100 [Vibrio coralliirubri]